MWACTNSLNFKIQTLAIQRILLLSIPKEYAAAFATLKLTACDPESPYWEASGDFPADIFPVNLVLFGK
jgi:hypothetical protein